MGVINHVITESWNTTERTGRMEGNGTKMTRHASDLRVNSSARGRNERGLVDDKGFVADGREGGRERAGDDAPPGPLTHRPRQGKVSRSYTLDLLMVVCARTQYYVVRSSRRSRSLFSYCGSPYLQDSPERPEAMPLRMAVVQEPPRDKWGKGNNVCALRWNKKDGITGLTGGWR
ncbi:hypothetical protein LX36DRAFT_463967 [Colletotrichum falcatum]|nr:hypothetical protein LX36DRAFT_463967 [Colletotrichum falcatum]